MDKNRVFENAEKTISEIIIILEKQCDLLKNQGYGNQKVSDLKQGLVKKNGIYVPLKSVDHKIMFDGYEFVLLETFLNLYKKMFANWKENLAQFSLRTLGELGFQRIQILFATEISHEMRKKYKLLIWLADYASLSQTNISYKANYLKLLEEYKDFLTEKESKFYTDLIIQLKGIKPLEEYKLIKDARRKISNLQASLYDQIKPLPFFREINIAALFSSFSHILHGNVLLLNDILNTKRPHSQQLRMYWGLLLVGVNVINRVGNNLNYMEGVEDVNKDLIHFQKIITQSWSEIEK